MADSPANNGFHVARHSLAKLFVGPESSLVTICRRAVQLSARTLNVDRVGIWLFDADGTTLTCALLDTPTEAGGPSTRILNVTDAPGYVKALADNRWICAEDAQNEWPTSELASSYLRPIGITSMLDAPIFREGRLFGVVCHEHVGPKRSWSVEDRTFAGSVADIIALLFEQAERIVAETAQRRLECKQHEQRSLEVLGRLAIRVAHDLNNVLGAFSNVVSLLARSDPASRARLESDAREAIGLGARLTRELKRVALAQATDKVRLDLVQILDDLWPVLRLVTQESAALTLRRDPEARPAVVAAPNQIEQILLNLVTNARRAVAGDGHIVVRLQPPVSDHPYVVLSVEDDGTGMTDDIQQRAMDPLFTTRPDAGLGWGLASVREIADELGGFVTIRTRLGQGTIVEVHLPPV
jgi:signal transduction histidine kinase